MGRCLGIEGWQPRLPGNDVHLEDAAGNDDQSSLPWCGHWVKPIKSCRLTVGQLQSRAKYHHATRGGILGRIILQSRGGTKTRQQRDIEDARELWRRYRSRKQQEV